MLGVKELHNNIPFSEKFDLFLNGKRQSIHRIKVNMIEYTNITMKHCFINCHKK